MRKGNGKINALCADYKEDIIMFEITIHVTGLDALAGAIARLAGAEGGKEQVPAGSFPVPAPKPDGQASLPAPAAPAAVPVTPAAAVPTAARTYTADELAKAAMTLMDAGKQMELIQLLASFGVNSIPALPPEQMGAFATALRGMGAQI